jgi:hypothetical protein
MRRLRLHTSPYITSAYVTVTNVSIPAACIRQHTSADVCSSSSSSSIGRAIVFNVFVKTLYFNRTKRLCEYFEYREEYLIRTRRALEFFKFTVPSERCMDACIERESFKPSQQRERERPSETEIHTQKERVRERVRKRETFKPS